jgi:prepilin-type N-terminal cleavage/methylation domain-containing protein
LKKLNAFTLIELTIALVLSAIIVSFALLIFRQVNQSYDIFKSTTEAQMQLIQFKEMLTHDIEQSNAIIKNEDNDFKLKIENLAFDTIGSINTIEYSWTKNVIKRKVENLAIDSFRFDFIELKFSLFGNPVTTQDGLIDGIYIRLNSNNQINLTFTKQYGAIDLIEL